ncbi:MAG: hypothetical protein KBT39_09435 [Bacteroidales bacterium]|nr:hypothetical protein [Bacteroidales bacterium]
MATLHLRASAVVLYAVVMDDAEYAMAQEDNIGTAWEFNHVVDVSDQVDAAHAMVMVMSQLTLLLMLQA